jgi:CBS domain-containing protein
MADRDLGSVLVASNGKVIGVFTEKDLVKRVIAPGKDPKTLTLSDVCSRSLISVSATKKMSAFYHRRGSTARLRVRSYL